MYKLYFKIIFEVHVILTFQWLKHARYSNPNPKLPEWIKTSKIKPVYQEEIPGTPAQVPGSETRTSWGPRPGPAPEGESEHSVSDRNIDPLLMIRFHVHLMALSGLNRPD